MKKYVSFCAIALLAMSFTELFAQQAKINNINYRVISEFNAEVSKQYSVDKNNIIKNNLKDSIFFQEAVMIKKKQYNVTSICDSAFFLGRNIHNIKINDNITTIGKNAFSYTNIHSVFIPESVSKIGTGAFSYCNALISISVHPNNNNFSSLNGVLFDKTVARLIQYPNGSPQTTYSIPESVTSIDDYAFALCNNLTSINIPATVTSIGKQAFVNCSNLKNINVDPANNFYTSVDGVLFDKNKTILINYPSQKNNSTYTIPNSVSTIEEAAFYNCTSLVDISVFDSTLINIKEAAFYNCTNLTFFHFPSTLQSIGKYAFSGCGKIKQIILPDKLNYLGDNAFASCTGITYLETGNELQRIEPNSFRECTNLKEAILGRRLISVTNYAFDRCSNLIIVLHFNNTTEFAKHAFDNCKSLKNSIKYVSEESYRQFIKDKKAAQDGDIEAQHRLALNFFNGEGIIEDKETAFQWFRKAALTGNHPQAQYYLGLCYTNGYGVSKSDKKAFEMYSSSAKQGNVAAESALGLCYKNGKGVEQNFDQAVLWLNRATNKGNSDAQKGIDEIRQIQNVYNDALIDLKQENYKNALTKFSNTISAYKNHVYSYINRGYCYTMIGDYKNARKDFNKALDIEPSNSIAKSNLEAIKKLISSKSKDSDSHNISPAMMQMNY